MPEADTPNYQGAVVRHDDIARGHALWLALDMEACQRQKAARWERETAWEHPAFAAYDTADETPRLSNPPSEIPRTSRPPELRRGKKSPFPLVPKKSDTVIPPLTIAASAALPLRGTSATKPPVTRPSLQRTPVARDRQQTAPKGLPVSPTALRQAR